MWELYNSKNEMKNPTGNKLEKLVFGIFDQMTEGADKYVTEQGSTWLIFTEDKRWVIEFTKDKTLWFNFNIFQGELDLIGKDCTEERDLIKNWFESRFLNKPKVDETLDNAANMIHNIEDAIENGVKDTLRTFYLNDRVIEDTIQNGVKDTLFGVDPDEGRVEDTIQNGLKDTVLAKTDRLVGIEDTIENGVKLIDSSTQIDGSCVIEDVIQEGVKEVRTDDGMVKRVGRRIRAINVLDNGVKETKHRLVESWEQKEHLATTFEITEGINDAIENGVKELKELPDKSGEFRGYGDYYRRQKDMTKKHTEYVKEVIEDSYNHRGRIEGVIRNTNKDGI